MNVVVCLISICWGRFHQQKRAAFSLELNYNPFWQMANKFFKKCANFSLKFGTLIVGGIEH